MAKKQAAGIQVALHTLVTHFLIHPEWEFHVPCIEMGINQVRTDKPSCEETGREVVGFGSHQSLMQGPSCAGVVNFTIHPPVRIHMCPLIHSLEPIPHLWGKHQVLPFLVVAECPRIISGIELKRPMG